MAIISVKEIWDGRGGDGDVRSGRRHARVFRVKTNSNFDSDVDATFSGTPIFGDRHPDDDAAFCQNVRADSVAFSPRVWIVTCSYSTEQELVSDPLSDPTRFIWGTEQFQRPYFKDRNGNAILNSAGDPFFPPIMGDDSRTSVTMTKNVSAVPAWFLLTRDKLNSAAVSINGISVGKERAKIQKVSAGDQQFRGNIAYFTIGVTMHVQDESWQKSIQDAGFRKLDPDDSTERVKIKDNNGEDVSTPALLNGSGAVLSDPSPSNAKFKDFDIYGTFDFTELPF